MSVAYFRRSFCLFALAPTVQTASCLGTSLPLLLPVPTFSTYCTLRTEDSTSTHILHFHHPPTTNIFRSSTTYSDRCSTRAAWSSVSKDWTLCDRFLPPRIDLVSSSHSIQNPVIIPRRQVEISNSLASISLFYRTTTTLNRLSFTILN